jgi:hypothetical protein
MVLPGRRCRWLEQPTQIDVTPVHVDALTPFAERHPAPHALQKWSVVAATPMGLQYSSARPQGKRLTLPNAHPRPPLSLRCASAALPGRSETPAPACPVTTDPQA